jgi:hypothetical protein
MSCFLARLCALVGIGFAVKTATQGDPLSIGVIIVACLVYIHAAVYEVVDQVVNGE